MHCTVSLLSHWFHALVLSLYLFITVGKHGAGGALNAQNGACGIFGLEKFGLQKPPPLSG